MLPCKWMGCEHVSTSPLYWTAAAGYGKERKGGRGAMVGVHVLSRYSALAVFSLPLSPSSRRTVHESPVPLGPPGKYSTAQQPSGSKAEAQCLRFLLAVRDARRPAKVATAAAAPRHMPHGYASLTSTSRGWEPEGDTTRRTPPLQLYHP